MNIRKPKGLASHFVSFILSVLIAAGGSSAHAHGGADETHAAPDSPSTGTVTYLDLGPAIRIGSYSLDQKLYRRGKVIYQHTTNQLNSASKLLNFSTQSKVITLDEPIEMPAFQIQVTAPSSTDGPIEINRAAELEVRWKSEKDTSGQESQIEILIEAVASENNGHRLLGRIRATALDQGSYRIPVSALSQLPAGMGRLAVKRIVLEDVQAGSDARWVRVAKVRSQVFDAKLR